MTQKRRLKIAVAGGGLIAQVEHIPNLVALRDAFELVAVSDPSERVRAHLQARFGLATVESAESLLCLELDALLVAAPDPWHGEIATRALRAGLHVFCEKPLCYGVREIDALIAEQRRSRRVLQVGYMKRFDPSYEAARRYVGGKGEMLRLVSVEVNDPDAAPFVAHHALVHANDVPAALAEATGQRRAAQVETALGFPPTPTLLRGFAGAYSSALVHDVNAVHGLLEAMQVETGRVRGAAIFAGGVGGHGSVELRGGAALWTMTHVEIPGVGDYRERISLYFENEVVELVFPAPYLNHHPTALTVRRAGTADMETLHIRSGFAEPFVLELEAFWASIVEGATPRNTADEARRDQELLAELARVAAL